MNVNIENTNENRQLLKNDKCDKYDYLIAAGCGAIGGLIDIFLVGTPQDSVLGKWTDKQVDNAVISFAKRLGWEPAKGSNEIASAIGFLERKYKINYDQRYTSDVNNLFNMSTKNHHMKSLSHSPDIIGLFFSILNQFTSTSSFIADGKIITIESGTFELKGSNFISKLFCGIANWFGHIMSDIAGSSGSRGNGGRGTGIVMPFYELFGFCKFGKFNVGKDKQDLATIATRAFQEGYDFRFGMAMAIPVVITELSIRLIWAIRRYFQFEKPLAECIPTNQHADLRVMLLFGHGTLCVMDGIDAGVRSGGNFLAFFMRLNLVGWSRFTMLVLKEICIRVGLVNGLEQQILAYKRINEVLVLYLKELEQIDIELFKKETEVYNQLVAKFAQLRSEKEWNTYLISVYEELKIEKAWKGDFNEFMSNSNNRLIFE